MTDLNAVALQAVADLVAQVEPDAMVTRFVLLAEIVGGDRAVWAFVAPDQRAWDTLGLLDYGRAIEHAAIATDD